MDNKCNHCDFEAKTSQGLAGHRRLAHTEDVEHSTDPTVIPSEANPVQNAALDENLSVEDPALELSNPERDSPKSKFSTSMYLDSESDGRRWHIDPAPICHTCGQQTQHWVECDTCQKLLPVNHTGRCWADGDNMGMTWDELIESTYR